VVEEEPVQPDPADLGPRPIGQHHQRHGQDGIGQRSPSPGHHRDQADPGQHQQWPADIDQPLALGAEALADQRPDRGRGVEHDLLPAAVLAGHRPLEHGLEDDQHVPAGHPEGEHDDGQRRPRHRPATGQRGGQGPDNQECQQPGQVQDQVVLAAAGDGQGDRGQGGGRPAPGTSSPPALGHDLEGQQGRGEGPPHDRVEMAGELEHPVRGAGVGQGAGRGQQLPAGVAAQPGERGQPGGHRRQGEGQVVGRDQAGQRPGDGQHGRPGHVERGGLERPRSARSLAQVEIGAAQLAQVVDHHRLDEEVLQVVAAVHPAGTGGEVRLGGDGAVAGHRPEVVGVQGQRPGQDHEGGQAGQGHAEEGHRPAAGAFRARRDRRRDRGAGGRCLGGAQGSRSASR
jgi:hypothetical protein